MASVTAALGKLLIDNQFRQDIKYKHQFADPANDNDELQDIFSGSVYRDLRNREVIQKNDFCLLMMVDGFQNKKSLKNASTLVHCMMMTTSTDNRYQVKSITSLLSVIDGPEKCTGDIPGIAELMGHHGHTSYFGCRICEVEGVQAQDSAHGIYFPGTGVDRTSEHLRHGNPSRNLDAVDPLFCNLNTFTGVEFFLGDEMHLLGQGLGKLVFNMLNPITADKYVPRRTPSSSSLSPPQYPFRMQDSSANYFKAAIIGPLVQESSRTVPSTFDRCWDDA
ncbi:hypothetical protein V8B55DRAFT_1594202 [Mucor lusitanicus]|uniref:Uncharacterized protein n=2 Tax=Mucor circinelloides f. lusitanicus TaxID=29924 RepID=A0A162RQ24_MUCCL|nr:hypothetical protein FB192DRAFT_1342480 [Mucor lusitanicus]OAD07889.1 hypothetical protein MUCCIDRAFT_77171 [Mucor lusitanicus CBS 277.49]